MNEVFNREILWLGLISLDIEHIETAITTVTGNIKLASEGYTSFCHGIQRISTELGDEIWIISIGGRRITWIIVPFRDTYREVFTQYIAHQCLHSLCHLTIAARFTQAGSLSILVAGIPMETHCIGQNT